MKTLTDHLSQYAAYHRDRRNIVTHFIGIPMILLAVVIFLSRPVFELAGISLSPAVIGSLVAGLFYLRLDIRFGLVMSAVLAVCVWVGSLLAPGSTSAWLSWGIALFVVGWVFQFVGHYWEGRKPAFVDDLIGLIIGPLFVAAEAAFMLGLRPGLKREVESRAGPVHGGEVGDSSRT